MTGLPARGTYISQSSTAVPLETTATRFPLAVYSLNQRRIFMKSPGKVRHPGGISPCPDHAGIRAGLVVRLNFPLLLAVILQGIFFTNHI